MTKRHATTMGGAFILIIAGVVAYHSGHSGKFLFDDRDSILVNSSIRQVWPPTWLTEAPSQHTVSGRPVVSLSLALNFAIGEYNVGGYHVFNLAVHILVSIVLFGVIRRTLGSVRFDEPIREKAGSIALVSALLWSIHPLQSECVYYIIQRTESMMALFFLLTLYCSIRALESRHRLFWTLVAVVSCALGMGCKESMAMAPLIVLLWDSCFAGQSFRERLQFRKSLYAGLAATWMVVGLIMVSGPRSLTVGTGLGVGAFQYLTNQCVVLVKYLYLLFWPHPLSIDYGEPIVVEALHFIFGGIVVVALLGVTVALLYRRPGIGFVGAWCFILLGPTSSVIPIITEVGAERRMYLPSAALLVLVVMACRAGIGRIVAAVQNSTDVMADRKAARLVSMLLVLPCVILLAWTSHARSADFMTQVDAWTSVVRACPDNPRAQCNLATELWAKKRTDEARAHYEKAVALKPGFGDAHYFYAMMLKELKEHGLAMQHFALAVQADPDDTGAAYELAQLYSNQGEETRALDLYRSILQVNPHHLGAHIQLAHALRKGGDHRTAANHFISALKVDPNNVQLHFDLGNALLEMGESAKGVLSLKNALIVKPNWVPALNRLGWVLSTHPDEAIRNPNEAIQFAQQAAQLTNFERAISLDILAAAYANANRFSEAVQTLEQGIELFGGRNTSRSRAMKGRLALYREGQAFREPIGHP